MDEAKAGALVGADKYGNKYYEDPSQFYGRNRWVEFAEYKNLEYDGSQIPAEWFGWMHYKVLTNFAGSIVKYIALIFISDRFATSPRRKPQAIQMDGRS